MVICLRLFVLFLKCIYFFLKLLPVKNKIVFISRQSDKPSKDMTMLAKKFNEKLDGYKCVFVTKKTRKTVSDGIKSIGAMLRQCYHLATSRVCITDGYNIPISVLKHKKSLKVVQIWHAMTAVKKFGCQCLEDKKKAAIAKVLKMHRNYDYITCAAPSMIPVFQKGFGYEKDVFVPIGLPRLDLLTDPGEIIKERIYKRYPEFKGRKLVLYAPTFRENDDYRIDELAARFEQSDYILIVKAHPLTNLSDELREKIYTCDMFSAINLLTVADAVISDYSAFALEAVAANKPIYLFTYDIDFYSKHPGINLYPYDDLPGCVHETAEDIFSAVDSGACTPEIVAAYRQKYLPTTSGSVTEKLVDFVIDKCLNDNEKA